MDGGPIVLQTECTVDIGNEVCHDLMNKLNLADVYFEDFSYLFLSASDIFSVSVLQQLSIFYFYFTLSPTSFH